MMETGLSILIVNWKSKEYLRRCLVTVRSTLEVSNVQVVVVDGGSFDGCGEMLAAEFPEVCFVQSPENLGFGRSNNLGFQSVTEKAVLLLNPDTELQPGAVQRLLQELRARPKAGIIGPKLLNTDGSLQTSCVQALPTPWNQGVDSEFLRRRLPDSPWWGVGEAFRSKTPVEVEAVSGACMLLWTDVFRQVGGFSPQFFMYGEDMDLCAKVRKAGLEVVHVPAAEVIHHGGGSSRTQVSQFSNIMIRVAGVTYMQLNHGRGAAWRYRLLQGLSALVRVAMLMPACVLLGRSRRTNASISLKKWWGVLRWALGCSLVPSPQPPSTPVPGALA